MGGSKSSKRRSSQAKQTRIAFTSTGQALNTRQINDMAWLLCPHGWGFPDDYTAFLRKYNGGTPDPHLFTWNHPNEGQVSSWVNDFFEMNPSSFCSTNGANGVTFCLTHRDDLPRYSVPIGTAVRDDILLLFTHGSRRGEVWIKAWGEVSELVDRPTDPEDAVYFVAGSFQEFLESLYAPDDPHVPYYIALDATKVRGKQLAGTLKSLGCRVYRYPGVMTRQSLPTAWIWPRFHGPKDFDEAVLSVERNLTYGYVPKFMERPKGHKMLGVVVAKAERQECLNMLLESLGTSAVLLGPTE